MKITKSALTILLATSVGVTSCKKDDDITPKPVANTQINFLGLESINLEGLEVPTTYTFTKESVSSVSFTGQTTRLKQVKQIGSGITNASISLEVLYKQFREGKNFSDASLENGKKVRGKVANSVGLFKGGATSQADELKLTFDGYLKKYKENVEQFVVKGTKASKGKAGIADAKRNVNAKGLEYNQAFYKSLLGGLVVDQVSNHYFNRLDDNFDNTNTYKKEHDENKTKEGKVYTTMEHHWDEAYGYVYGVASSEDVLLQKYIGKVEKDADFAGTANTISRAFTIGRAAIVSKKYKVRDQAVKVIRSQIAKVVAVRAVYYLQQGKAKLTPSREKSFHDLSEGYGFINSLQYITVDGKTPIFTETEINSFINDLEAENGFWDIKAEELDKISNAIANKFDFTVSQAAN